MLFDYYYKQKLSVKLEKKMWVKFNRSELSLQKSDNPYTSSISFIVHSIHVHSYNTRCNAIDQIKIDLQH